MGSYPITKGGKVKGFRSRGTRSKSKPKRVVIVRDNLTGAAEAFAKTKGWVPTEEAKPKLRQYCFWDADHKPKYEDCLQCREPARSQCGIRLFGRSDAYHESRGHLDQRSLTKALAEDGMTFRAERDRIIVAVESDSHPGTYYDTSIWTADSGRSKAGDVSCNCKGWIYRKYCRHTEKLVHRYM